ncbi:TIR domain-containing protein [Pseudofrankia sp. BMG5.36]|uniref:TIR domain-containing protein n=1 Tax=Pseudofrankia sp. BMG5.36 TaxID=1834512 RepID=UPI000E2A3B66
MADGGGPRARVEPGWDVFVSYAPEDEAWAQWIVWQLRCGGRRHWFPCSPAP